MTKILILSLKNLKYKFQSSLKNQANEENKITCPQFCHCAFDMLHDEAHQTVL